MSYWDKGNLPDWILLISNIFLGLVMGLWEGERDMLSVYWERRQSLLVLYGSVKDCTDSFPPWRTVYGSWRCILLTSWTFNATFPPIWGLCVEWLVSCFPSHLKLNTSKFSSFIFFNIGLRLHCSRISFPYIMRPLQITWNGTIVILRERENWICINSNLDKILEI